MSDSEAGGRYQDKLAEFGDIALLNKYRGLKRKKEHNQRERERLEKKDRELDKQMELVAGEIERRDEVNLRSQDTDS